MFWSNDTKLSSRVDAMGWKLSKKKVLHILTSKWKVSKSLVDHLLGIIYKVLQRSWSVGSWYPEFSVTLLQEE